MVLNFPVDKYSFEWYKSECDCCGKLVDETTMIRTELGHVICSHCNLEEDEDFVEDENYDN